MIALANLFRPSKFEDVVGQEYIIKILQNQIETDEVKSGYLMKGGAGTGKTTIARIFANSIDAEVLEIDGASNNGVDNIRDIIERVQYKSITHKRIAVIIDEVHMLSIGAFNSLLKTLEEPPAHVVFILCTTDAHKIPATILSRVQQFTFKRMTLKQIKTRLEYIILQSKKSVSVEAIDYIAKLSNGGMRSAISLLDTCLSYSTESLTVDTVTQVVGASSYETYIAIISNLGDSLALIDLVEIEHENGRDLKQLVKGLLEFLVEIRKYGLTRDINYTTIPSMYQQALDSTLENLRGKSFNDMFTSLLELSRTIQYEPSPKYLIQGGLMTL